MSGDSVLGRLRRRPLRIPPLSLDGAVRLKARGVSVAYGPWPILSDIDLDVRAGEVLCLVGPNGAGKSTLLGVLSGDVAPASGSVLVDDEPLDAWTARELALHRAVMLQSVGVTFPFSVTQVVRMGRAPWAGTDAEEWDDVVVARAIVDADLATFTERVYSSLSGGERARAALARTLAQEPVVLLLDEPTAALDLRHQELAFSLARERAARGDAVVIVLHDLALAAAYADVIVVLHHGRIAAAGPPADVLSAELLSRVYEHPIEVLRHPRTGALVVLPERDISPRRTGAASAIDGEPIAALVDSPPRRSDP